MADGHDAPQEVQLSLAWVGVEDVAIQFANQFAIIVDQDEIILSVGQVSAPIIVGSPAERMEAAAKIGVVPIATTARFSMTPRRVIELRDLLNRAVENHGWGPSDVVD